MIIKKFSLFLSYFEKIAHMSVVWTYASWPCMFGCLLQEPIRLKVLWVDAQEPMRSWHLFKHGIAKRRQGHFETAILILHNFFVFYYGYRCLEALHFKNIFMIQTLCTVMQLFNGSYFSVDAASGHFWPNSAIANGTTHVFMSSVSRASTG